MQIIAGRKENTGKGFLMVIVRQNGKLAAKKD